MTHGFLRCHVSTGKEFIFCFGISSELLGQFSIAAFLRLFQSSSPPLAFSFPSSSSRWRAAADSTAFSMSAASAVSGEAGHPHVNVFPESGALGAGVA